MLGRRIAALRKAAGMSQAQLASILNVSTSAVGMYEQGRREPSTDMLIRLSGAFGVTIDFLVTGNSTFQSERWAVEQMLMERLEASGIPPLERQARPFSWEEMAALFAALLVDR